MYLNNLRLKYGFPALPALADRNGEAIVNWTDNGNHSVTADATHVHSGTKSFKLHATGAGDSTTNYIDLPSGASPTWVVGNQYCITFWYWCASSVNLRINFAGGLTPVQAVGGSAWTPISFVFTATSATYFIQMFLSASADMWFDDITVSQYVDLNAQIEKGMSDPDMFELYPPQQNNYIDGSIDTQFMGFRRKMFFYCGVVAARSDRLGVLYWFVDNNRQIDYLTEYQVPVTPNWHNSGQTQGEYMNNWIQDFNGGREFTIELLDSVIRTAFPN